MSNTEVNVITLEQSELVFKFLDSLFGDDVKEYWECISKIDQARVFGMYRAAMTTNVEEISFFDYVKEYFKKEQEKVFESVREYPGLASHVRYTDSGEILLYVIKDVQVPRVYIAETQVEAVPIVLTIDTDIDNGNVTSSWKVRIYEDQFYKDLNSN